MIEAEIYRGIEYIQLTNLPKAQQQSIYDWASGDQIIKILKDDELLSNCIQFKDYQYWFRNVLNKESEQVVRSETNKVPQIRFALNN